MDIVWGFGLGFANIGTARAIQQELLNDFASKSEMSNWFDRVRIIIERVSSRQMLIC